MPRAPHHTALQLRKPPSQRQQRLLADALSAMRTLQQLCECKRRWRGRPPLIPNLLRASKAVAFLTKRTIGTGLLGWGWGYGLVLRRLEGEGRWSAPSYFRIRKLSLGFILGSRRRQSLLCIRDDTSLEHYLGAEFFAVTGMHFGFDVGSGSAKQVGTREFEEACTGCEGQASPWLLTWDIDSGVLWDMSLKLGMMTTDVQLDKELMGPCAKPLSLLKGEAPPPPDSQPIEFAELYDLLNRLSNWEYPPHHHRHHHKQKPPPHDRPPPSLAPAVPPAALVASIAPGGAGARPAGARSICTGPTCAKVVEGDEVSCAGEGCGWISILPAGGGRRGIATAEDPPAGSGCLPGGDKEGPGCGRRAGSGQCSGAREEEEEEERPVECEHSCSTFKLWL